eukprot:4881584-Alexandrium_andersonii.AAC.1
MFGHNRQANGSIVVDKTGRAAPGLNHGAAQALELIARQLARHVFVRRRQNREDPVDPTQTEVLRRNDEPGAHPGFTVTPLRRAID